MTILLAVCGSISFYKAFEILSQLKKYGASVRVLLSPGAQQFCSPLAFEALCDAVLASNTSWQPGSLHNHIAFSRGADALLIAPASANTINKIAAGIADNEFLATILAAQDIPLIIAPAANARMLAGISEQNIAALQNRGAFIIPPVRKKLACGEIAAGALADAKQIADICMHIAAQKSSPLAGQKLLISAGATSEKIDSVRCISNLSSGKFGAAFAHEAYLMGAKVVLAQSQQSERSFYDFKQIAFSSSAQLAQILSEHEDASALICAAAISDFVPVIKSGKISREQLQNELIIKGRQNYDLLQAAKNPLKIAFKLEPIYSAQTVQKARAAMQKKGAALCVLNTLDEIDFASEHTRVHLLSAQDEQLFAGSKNEVAKAILLQIAKLLNAPKCE